MPTFAQRMAAAKAKKKRPPQNVLRKRDSNSVSHAASAAATRKKLCQVSIVEQRAASKAEQRRFENRLYKAILDDNIDDFKALREHRRYVDYMPLHLNSGPTVDSFSVLHLAAGCGSVKIASFLLEDRPESKDWLQLSHDDEYFQCTPLENAACEVKWAALDARQSYSGSDGEESYSGRPIWTDAHKYNERERRCHTIMELLLTAGADVNRGASALSHVCYSGSVASAKLLLEHGADANKAGEVQHKSHRDIYVCEPPLWTATSQGHLEIVRLLLQHGADVDATITYKWIEGVSHEDLNNFIFTDRENPDKDRMSRTPLAIALQYSTNRVFAEIASLLEAAGAHSEYHYYRTVDRHDFLRSSTD